MTIDLFDKFFIEPPPFPKRLRISNFFDLANLASFIRLTDCFFFKFPPDVENINKTSFLLYKVENSLVK